MARNNILLFGSNYMAEEYLKVLRDFDCKVVVVGRDQEKATELASKYKGIGLGGGVTALDNIDVKEIDLVIIASAVESLKEVACHCLRKGFDKILLEKPGALSLRELKIIKDTIGPRQRLGIAYNRRFYNSIIELKKRLSADGDLLGCFFDFSEREKDLINTTKSNVVVAKWGWANSSHVIDTAFHLIGLPLEICSWRSGSWGGHQTGTNFSGSGKTNHCLFGYFSAWGGGGRWNVEISTAKGKYRLSPMEELQFCKKDQFNWETIASSDDDDLRFKPGLYKIIRQVLLEDSFANLSGIDDQIKLCEVVNKIFGYEN